MSKYNNGFRSGDRHDIDLSSILRDVRDSWFRILLIAVSAAMLAYAAFSNLHTPLYTVNTTFAVNQSQGMGSTYTAYDTAKKFESILENQILHRKVAEDLGLEDFDAELNVNIVTQTNLMVLSVTARSPYEAFRVLNAVLENYSSVSDYVIPGIVLETIERPIITDVSSNQLPINRYMVLAFLLGGLLTISLVVLSSYSRDTVKNEAEFKAKVDGDLLGTIYHEKKKRKVDSMLISNPLLSFRYVESFRMVAARIKGRMDKKQAKIIMITSVLENEGKSTAASNLALALAQEQKKVMLLDCDFRKPALYKIFEFAKTDGQTDLTEVLRGEKGTAGLIKKKKNESIYFGFCYTPTESSTEMIVNGNLKKILNACTKTMDYIVLDTPPMGLVADAEELVKLVDCAVLVVRQDMVLTRDINDALDVLNQDDENKVIGCIFSNVLPDIATSITRGKNAASTYGNYGNYASKKVN